MALSVPYRKVIPGNWKIYHLLLRVLGSGTRGRGDRVPKRSSWGRNPAKVQIKN